MLSHVHADFSHPPAVLAFRAGERAVRVVGQQAAEVPAPQPDVVPLPPSPHPVPVPPPGPPEVDEPVEPGEHAPVRDPPATPPVQTH